MNDDILLIVILVAVMGLFFFLRGRGILPG